MEKMRLQKFLSMAGICSRRQGEEYIKAGRVKVNGEVVTEMGFKVNPETDRVSVSGQQAKIAQKTIYIALNKPEGYVTSCKHPDEKIVLDLVDLDPRLFPVGRLDKDSVGLVLLTNDGRIHHKLLHPSYDHEKEYVVAVEKPISDGALRKMAQGMPMMGARTRPAEITRISKSAFKIVLKEGKNRQIRRMVRKVGNRVTRLKRIRIANIELGELPAGRWRYLTKMEIKALLNSLELEKID